MTICSYCGARVDNGLTLCDLCQRKVTTILEYLPVYFGNLTRWRPGRAGSRQVPGSRVLWDGALRVGSGDRISRTLFATDDTLTRWAGKVVTARPYLAPLYRRLTAARAAERVDDAQAIAWLCLGFTRHLSAIATLPDAGDFVRDLDRHERRLRTFTETYIPGWYAGSCRHCGTDTHVVPGLTWVTCPGCGATSHAADQLDVVLAEARDWVAPPKRLAEAIVALIDTEPSVPALYERIKKWQQRGRLECVDSLGYTRELDYAGEKYGPRRSRLGDVLDTLTDQATATREQLSTEGGG